MATRLEKTQTKKAQVKRCLSDCPGQLQSDLVTRVFRRTGSAVEVIIEEIPADLCSVCGRAFFSREVARGLDQILFPFHGKHTVIPDLPPAKVIVDFTAARKKRAA
jgi:YgiT-type zinc finger domain-containing protein